MLNKKVEAYIKKHGLMSHQGRYLVALSGGADSVALLCLLTSLGYSVEAVHCNFHLRGEESNRDEEFCKKLCEDKGIALHIAHFDTLAYSELHKVSVEMAARDLRYNYFEQLRQDLNFNGICVAHHKNDSVETLLLNLCRGTGIEGLKGIAPRNGFVLRPLLSVTRCELTDYLASLKQDYIIDSTNLIDDVQRNFLRLNVMPLLREINPAVDENISKTMERVADALKIMNHAVEESKKRILTLSEQSVSISIPLLLQEISPELVLWEILKDYGFSSSQVEQIYANLSAQSGKEWKSTSHLLLIDRDCMIIEPISDVQIKEILIPETGTYLVDEGLKYSISTCDVDTEFSILKTSEAVSLDAGKITFPLTIRLWRQGDSFIPFGMNGKKLISDFLTDKKLTLFQKRRQRVVVDAKDNILWVIGLRSDNRFCINSETKHALIIKKISP